MTNATRLLRVVPPSYDSYDASCFSPNRSRRTHGGDADRGRRPGEDWLPEIKSDGYRTILAVDGERTKAYSRTGLDWSASYRSIVEAAAKLPCPAAILGGQDERGVTDWARSDRQKRQAP
jgi:ATP-dependent DNA ligase